MERRKKVMALRRDRRCTIVIRIGDQVSTVGLEPEVKNGRLQLRLDLPEGATIENARDRAPVSQARRKCPSGPRRCSRG